MERDLVQESGGARGGWESRTGFDFFANVPANLQTVAEQASHSLW